MRTMPSRKAMFPDRVEIERIIPGRDTASGREDAYSVTDVEVPCLIHRAAPETVRDLQGAGSNINATVQFPDNRNLKLDDVLHEIDATTGVRTGQSFRVQRYVRIGVLRLVSWQADTIARNTGTANR